MFISYFSYKCDDYVSNDLEYNPIDKIRQSIMQLRRQHDVESNGNLEQSEDNSKDGSEGGNSMMSSTSVSDKPASPSGSGDDSRAAEVISAVSFGDEPNLPETSDSKPAKSIKVSVYYLITWKYYKCSSEQDANSILIFINS